MPGSNGCLEAVEVDCKPIRGNEPEPFSVLWQDIVSDCNAEPVESLTKGVSCLVLVDAAPKHVDDFIAPDLLSDCKKAQKREWFAPAKSGWNGARRVAEGRRSKEAKLEERNATLSKTL